ncbi:MAG: hypothetical protein ACJ76F_07355 [Bacteroidia bacterium]
MLASCFKVCNKVACFTTGTLCSFTCAAGFSFLAGAVGFFISFFGASVFCLRVEPAAIEFDLAGLIFLCSFFTTAFTEGLDFTVMVVAIAFLGAGAFCFFTACFFIAFELALATDFDFVAGLCVFFESDFTLAAFAGFALTVGFGLLLAFTLSFFFTSFGTGLDFFTTFPRTGFATFFPLAERAGLAAFFTGFTFPASFFFAADFPDDLADFFDMTVKLKVKFLAR